MADYVAAVDQGTTSTRCMIFNHNGLPVGMHQMEHKQIYPQAGWVEHDAIEIWARTQDVIKGALKAAKITANDIAAVGVTNQRETTVVWDKKTGKPYYNAIVWQDTRTDKLIKQFEGNAARTASATRSACRWRPTSPAPRCAGFWITCPKPRPPPSAATPSSAISTPG